jgi:hypothetical protein
MHKFGAFSIGCEGISPMFTGTRFITLSLAGPIFVLIHLEVENTGASERKKARRWRAPISNPNVDPVLYQTAAAMRSTKRWSRGSAVTPSASPELSSPETSVTNRT